MYPTTENGRYSKSFDKDNQQFNLFRLSKKRTYSVYSDQGHLKRKIYEQQKTFDKDNSLIRSKMT